MEITKPSPGQISIEYERRWNAPHLWTGTCTSGCRWATEGTKPRVRQDIQNHLNLYHGGEGEVTEPAIVYPPSKWIED